MKPSVVGLCETLIRFGEASQLVGVLSRAARPGVQVGRPVAKRLGVLLLNAGVIGRMGPHRFNVKLGRAMARLDHPVLRFDLSGMGDSGHAGAARTHAEQVVQDIRAAVDVLERETGADSVLIVGICSGANQGWQAALEDRRIAGLVMIDAFAYPASRTALHYHLLRMRWRTPTEILALAGRALAALPRRLAGLLRGADRAKVSDRDSAAAGGAASDEDSKPSASAYAMHMQSLVDRDARMLLIYTGTWVRYYSYPQQFAETFGRYPFASRVVCEFVPQFDHTFTLVSAQQAVIGRIVRWTHEQWHNESEMADEAAVPTSSQVPTEVEGPRSTVREPFPQMLAD